MTAQVHPYNKGKVFKIYLPCLLQGSEMTHELKILRIPKTSTEVVSQQYDHEFVRAEVLSDSPPT